MMAVLRMTKREELKVIPILFRHSPGIILRGRIYIISEEAATALHEAGIVFRRLAPTGRPSIARGETPGGGSERLL
jgi:hypothetical protein